MQKIWRLSLSRNGLADYAPHQLFLTDVSNANEVIEIRVTGSPARPLELPPKSGRYRRRECMMWIADWRGSKASAFKSTSR